LLCTHPGRGMMNTKKILSSSATNQYVSTHSFFKFELIFCIKVRPNLKTMRYYIDFFFKSKTTLSGACARACCDEQSRIIPSLSKTMSFTEAKARFRLSRSIVLVPRSLEIKPSRVFFSLVRLARRTRYYSMDMTLKMGSRRF
jgi:hypothetical protein